MMRNKPPRRTKKGLLVGFLSAAVLTLSGCVKAQVEYEFQEDNTVSMHMLMMEQEETKGMLYSSEEELEESCKQAVEEVNASDDEEENLENEYEVVVNDEGLSGCRIIVHGMEIPVLDTDDGEASGRIGDEFILRGDSFDLIPTGLDEAPEGFPQPEVAMRFTFPGKISETTIGEISEDKRSVTITDFTAASGEPFEIRASAVPSEGFSLTNIIVIAVGAILVVGVILGGLFLIKRNRDDDDDDDDDEEEDDSDDDDDDDDNDNNYAAQQYPSSDYSHNSSQVYDAQDYENQAPAPQAYPQQQSQHPYAPYGQQPVSHSPTYPQQEQYAAPRVEEQYSNYDETEYGEGDDDYLPPPPPPPPTAPPSAAAPKPKLPSPRAPQAAPAPRQAPALPKPSNGLPGAPAPRPGGNAAGKVKKLPPLPPPPPRFNK